MLSSPFPFFIPANGGGKASMQRAVMTTLGISMHIPSHAYILLHAKKINNVGGTK